MKRLLSLCLLLLSISLAVQAIPARRKPFTVKQSDGSTLTLIVCGDESFHYRATLDGAPVMRGADGNYYYARLAADGWQATAVLAHDEAMRSEAERACIDKEAVKAEARRRFRMRQMRRTAKRALRTTRAEEQISPYTGERKGLVILVNFKDKKMNAKHTRQSFDDMMNKEGYSENEASGSVHDYFSAQSYGQFNLTFDVVGPVTVSKAMSYYGSNDSYGNDKHPEEMVVEACRLANSQVDFSRYDWDGDGEADQVYVIYAGYGEHCVDEDDTEGAKTIWPHEWTLEDAGTSLTLDGVKINTYACSSELYSNLDTRIDGIGTPCHEFSHCLGLPDFYDTSYEAFGLGMWSLLDCGADAGDSNAPVGFTSYERMHCGWLTPTELSSACRVSGMKPLASSPEAYIIYNDANRNEYYLLENRQPTGNDAEVPGSGLLVLHVDYDETAWFENTVNSDANHQRCTIIPADGETPMYGDDLWSYYSYLSSMEGDPYPGTSGNTSLTDTSSPAAKLYHANTNGKKLMGKPLTGITESADGLITFSFMGGTEPPTGISRLTLDSLGTDTPVTVFAPSGQRLFTTTPAAFRSAPLPAGVYLLQSAQGTVKAMK